MLISVQMQSLQKLANFITKVPKIGVNSVYLRRMSSEDVSMLEVGPNRKIAYRLHEGKNTQTTVVFVPGFMSTMEGFKAKTLEKFCQEDDRRYVRFDFEGIGKSPGNISKLFIGNWIEDLRCIVDNLVPHKVLLVGSSMGGWFSLKIAEERPEKIEGMILVAPAINFFKYYYDFFYKTISDEDRATLDSGKVLVLKKNFGEIFLRKDLMEESLKHHIDLSKPINVTAPVRILHGVLDPDVPYKQSLQLMNAMTSLDVDVTFRKEGGHQMSEEADLELLTQTLRAMLSKSSL